MKSLFLMFLYGLLTLPMAGFTWFATFFLFNQSFGTSVLWAFLSGGTLFIGLRWRTKSKWLKRNHITGKEYRYIQSNLKEARQKIRRLNKALLRIRSIDQLKKIGTLKRMIDRIFRIVKNEPKRFYNAERFFFYHLDSVVELSERYTFLTRQRIQEPDIRQALTETGETLDRLTDSVEQDLLTVLAQDVDHLHTELDVAKLSIHRQNEAFPNERR